MPKFYCILSLIFSLLYFPSLSMKFPNDIEDFYLMNDEEENVLSAIKLKDISSILLKEFWSFISFRTNRYMNEEKLLKANKIIKRTDIKKKMKRRLDQSGDRDLAYLIYYTLIDILKTKNGKFLFLKLLYHLKKRERQGNRVLISFQRDDATLQNGNQIHVKISDLLSSTDFCIGQGPKLFCVKEKRILPDIYIFHELVHLLHWLEDENTQLLLSNGINNLCQDIEGMDKASLAQCFPPAIRNNFIIDYEEMRTIIGFPYTPNKIIICENSYRQERRLAPRINLLDAAQTGPLPGFASKHIIDAIGKRYLR